MGEWYIGEIRLFAMDWAPQYWLLCDGSTYPISQYQALAWLLGQSYGGDGETKFAVPDLRGRVPLCMGQAATGPTYQLAAQGGQENVALTEASVPAHSHALGATPEAATVATLASIPAVPSAAHPLYTTTQAPVMLNAASLTTTGAGAAHRNMQPFTVLNFCIATYGYFPPRW